MNNNKDKIYSSDHTEQKMAFIFKIKQGWMYIFASFNLWCKHILNDLDSQFWIDGFYNFDNGPEELELNWSTYEIAMKYQKKPRGRGKLKYPDTITGFLKWQNERKKEPQKASTS